MDGWDMSFFVGWFYWLLVFDWNFFCYLGRYHYEGVGNCFVFLNMRRLRAVGGICWKR